MLAAVIVCVFTGLFGGLQVYLAQLVWPDYHNFTSVETAFLDVSRTVGGEWLFQILALILVVGSLGSALTAQTGVARLLYGMSRGGSLPVFFRTSMRAPDRPRETSCWSAYSLASEPSSSTTNVLPNSINFGAFLAFMGVNAAVIRHSFGVRFSEPGYGHLLEPYCRWQASSSAS